MDTDAWIALIVILFLAGLVIRPIRMAMGLLLVILGVVCMATALGFCPGMAIVLFGGIMMFSGGGQRIVYMNQEQKPESDFWKNFGRWWHHG